jgi:hypothetical protein
MDDDVAVSPESIKRTYNLLRLLKEEYRDAMISGAMLNFEIGEDQWEDIGFMTPEGHFRAVQAEHSPDEIRGSHLQRNLHHHLDDAQEHVRGMVVLLHTD